jgi:hypothetical protein
MEKRTISGDLLSRGQETQAQMSTGFLKMKFYKMRLVKSHPTIFGDYPRSDQWELLLKAMKDDLHKRKLLEFRHPQDKEKVFQRHYIGAQANGVVLMTIGQEKKPTDFAFVWIVLKSAYYGEPYLVFVKFTQSFRNPDNLAKMVECAFNWELQGKGVELVLEPWAPKENTMWAFDFNMSFIKEMKTMDPNDLVLVGYEDVLEDYQMRLARKEEIRKPKVIKKSDDIVTYILADNKEAIVCFLHQALKGQKTAKGIARPFRFLFDHQLTEHIPFKAVMKEFPELKGLIKVRSYNDWTNPNSTSYDNDPQYKKMKDTFKLFS